jgi:hypothetical protein
MIRLAFLLIPVCLPAIAAPTGFAERGLYASGAANVEPAYGGEFVFAAPPADGRRKTQAVLVGRPERQIYTFMSAQEELALLDYRDKELAKRAAAMRALTVQHARRPFPKIDWPKVVVRGGDICVPTLDYSEATDWRDHLVCQRVGGAP